MADKEKPLPKPSSTPFGRKRVPGKTEEDAPLMADQIALAAAEGKLEEFMESEVPGGEHARRLVSMMMGMTGVMPPDAPRPPAAAGEKPSSGTDPASQAAEPPEDVINAVQSGDVQELMGLLAREYKKRAPEGEDAKDDVPGRTEKPAMEKQSVEKETIDALIRIAAENDLSPDWIIMRALKLYIKEYQKAGRL